MPDDRREPDPPRHDIVLAVYVAASLVFFVLPGRGEAGQWQENLSSTLKDNSLAIFLGNLANVLRTICSPRSTSATSR